MPHERRPEAAAVHARAGQVAARHRVLHGDAHRGHTHVVRRRPAERQRRARHRLVGRGGQLDPVRPHAVAARCRRHRRHRRAGHREGAHHEPRDVGVVVARPDSAPRSGRRSRRRGRSSATGRSMAFAPDHPALAKVCAVSQLWFAAFHHLPVLKSCTATSTNPTATLSVAVAGELHRGERLRGGRLRRCRHRRDRRRRRLELPAEVRVEDLDPVVARVGHVDLALRVGVDADRAPEVVDVGAVRRAPATEVRARRG